MSSSLPYSVVTTQNKVLPFLKVVGNLDVSGTLTVDGNSRFNSTITDSTGSRGIAGSTLTSNGAILPVYWALPPISVIPIIFFGKRTLSLALANVTYTIVGDLTDDVINLGAGFNTATGRFTSPVSGYYNLFCSGQFTFTGNNGQETNSYFRIYNTLNVLQREYISQNYAPITPLYGALVSSININYYLPTGYYVTWTVWVEDITAPATQLRAAGSFFGGSRFAD